MNSNATKKKFPASPEEWEALIAAAPDHVDDPDCPYDPNDPEQVEAFWKDGVVVRSGGYPAVRAALAEKRRQREAERAQTETVSLPISREVLHYFRANGTDWQARMNEALLDWIKTHPATTPPLTP